MRAVGSTLPRHLASLQSNVGTQNHSRFWNTGADQILKYERINSEMDMILFILVLICQVETDHELGDGHGGGSLTNGALFVLRKTEKSQRFQHAPRGYDLSTLIISNHF